MGIGSLAGGGAGLQFVNGSPTYPSIHVQIGVWFMTLQTAFNPQDPGHGSVHLFRMQALLLAHSGFIVHSWRQLGGDPK